MSGSATICKYKNALESVKYDNSSGSPKPGDRTVTWVVNDGTSNSASVTTTIGVTAANAPVLAGLGGVLSYTESDGAKTIDSRINVTDNDSSILKSATVQISGGYVGSEDLLAFSDTSEITGSYSQSTGVLTLTGDATVAQYKAALESITYQNINDGNPNTANRTLTWRVNDGSNDSSPSVSTIL